MPLVSLGLVTLFPITSCARLRRWGAGTISAVVLAVATRGDVTLAPLFSDHAVLQRDKPIPVWGRAQVGETVSVSFHGQSHSTVTDANGRWQVELSAVAGTSEGADLVVSGKSSVVLHDIVVGEVWLCSGQSNMAFTVKEAANASVEIPAGSQPLIRHLAVRKTAAAAPQASVGVSAWETATPQTVGAFTAVGYFFARDLATRLGVPIGLINSSWGGTSLEVWISAETLGSDPAFSIVNERWKKTLAEYPQKKPAYDRELISWKKAAEAARSTGTPAYAAFVKAHPAPREPQGPESPWAVSNLYNGMIEPLAPYALRRFLWYQGENNVFRAREYHRLFAAMITSWRARFGQGDVPFYWVQLAAFPSRPGADWPALRQAQTQTLMLPNTGQAIAIDIGDADTIHPRNKQDVGLRLALIAASRDYGLRTEFEGPTADSVTADAGKLCVHFSHANGGLHVRSPPVASFEVAGTDGIFFPALADLSGDTVVARSEKVPAPVAVRYAWSNFPVANLYNAAGLPALPFQRDLGAATKPLTSK